jgi:hypothetical protein
MPRPRKELEKYRERIERRVASGQTHKEIRRWLAIEEGVLVSKNTLSTRCVAWKANRHSRTAASEPALVSAIETAFYTTQHDDETIAYNITAQGTPTTRNQVKEVRLANNWRRRGNDETQIADSRSETFRLIA